MTDLLKNVFWYAIREMCNKKMLPVFCTFYIPDRLKTQKMYDEALKDEPRKLSYVPDNLKSQGACIKMV